jgi:HTH-type transcriptional regulator/antitoxin HigA
MIEESGKVAAPIRKLNRTKYARLLAEALPAVIKTEEENERMLIEIEKLMDKGDRLTTEELALLELMSRLVEDYEEDAPPHRVLQHLMEANNRKQADLLPILGSRGYISDVVNGRRGISKENAKALGEFFNVSPELFL